MEGLMVTADCERAFRYYRRLKKVEVYVGSNYASRINVTKVARIAGMEPNYFSSFFHKKTGVKFTRWLAGVRVAEARRLMREANVAIPDIATAVGYGDIRTFERAFKSVTNMTPIKYKMSVRPSADSPG